MNNGFTIICLDCNTTCNSEDYTDDDFFIEIDKCIDVENNGPLGEFTEIKCTNCGNKVKFL